MNQSSPEHLATAVVNVSVLPGNEEQFLAWQDEMNAEVASFPGFVRTSLVPPSGPEPGDFVVIYQFADQHAMRNWLESQARADLLVRSRSLLAMDQATSVVVGGEQATFRHEPVTAVITVAVQPGAEETYRAWERRMDILMTRQPGHLGTRLQAPISGVQDHWVVMTRFDSAENLDRWMNSAKRAQMLAEIEPFATTVSVRQAHTNFDGWFPFDEFLRPPSVWQQSALVLLVLFPVVMLEIIFLNPLLAWMPLSPATFIGNAISVGATGFFLIPIAARKFGWWTDPRASRRQIWMGTAIILALFAASVLVLDLLARSVHISPII